MRGWPRRLPLGVVLPYTALLSFFRRLFASAPVDDIAVTEDEAVPSPMSDRDLSRTIKELRDSPLAESAFRRGGDKQQ